MQEKRDIVSFIEELDKTDGFFNNINEINKYNMGAIIELIQYNNMKEFGNPIYTRDEIRRGIKKYLTKVSN
ncbi:hypothetical protein SAMN05446037_1002246 [Anaerovirgula multivorans]|uniref:Uncharacterized protein n=1 Tax=Anaerovirgula multivorans TaxID=312168 RepID=A0A239ASR6_9FIRM|nr:hypothetical protein [Anaerovirgula multivorans]SNR98746.1 hypothetical protein SAMN05446037_1002246 [Anaerovirgula multivorans]